MAYEADNSHAVPRQALCILQAYPVVPVIEAIVGLSDGKATIKSWTEASHGMPPWDLHIWQM